MPRWPTGPFTTHRTGCYGCVRSSPADGACGVSSYPCTHPGSDLFATSPEVFAAASGQVVAVSDGNSAPWVGYGPGIVVIRSADDGVFLLTAHLNPSTIAVSVGDQVAEGDHIADFDAGIGHTHFEVRRALTGPSSSNTMDPALWVAGASRTAVNLLLFGFILWGGYRLLR